MNGIKMLLPVCLKFVCFTISHIVPTTIQTVLSRSNRLVGFHLLIIHLHQKTICSATEMLQSSTSIQCIFCMGHYVHISNIDDQAIGSVWTTFQLNASAKTRLAGPADEKSLGEKSCKVTDQRGTQWPPPLVRVFPTNE